MLLIEIIHLQGYINLHFLNRLLKIIVDRNNLGEFNVDFTGPDAPRAQVRKIISTSDIL